jgi:hypothetical protein
MDLLGVQKDLDQAKKDLADALDRIAILEAQTAKDVSLIAGTILAGVTPLLKSAVDAVNTITLTVNATAVELQAIVRRLDGANLTLALGPEAPQ